MKIQLDTKYMKKIIEVFRGDRSYRSLLMDKDSLILYIHDKTLGRKSNPKYLKKAFENFQSGKPECGVYGLYEVEKHLDELESFAFVVDNSSSELEAYAINRLKPYVSMKYFKNVKGILYPFGRDGGFALLPKSFYMNVQTFKNDFESFKPVYAHEIYHARKRHVMKFLKFFLSQFLSKERSLTRELGWIIEEGIASLVELGVDLEYIPLSSITPHELEHIEDHFNIVNMRILNDPDYKEKVEAIVEKNRINQYLYKYQVGYYIARKVYLSAGITGLNHWTEDCNYKSVMKIYIESCRSTDEKTYLDESIENIIMKEA